MTELLNSDLDMVLYDIHHLFQYLYFKKREASVCKLARYIICLTGFEGDSISLLKNYFPIRS